MKTIYIFGLGLITACIQLPCCQSLFFQKQPTLSSAQLAAQEKIKNVVIRCMEQEKSNPLHVYALFAVHAQNSQAKCVLLCVMHNCHLMDKEGNYDEQKIEEIMRRTEPKPHQSRFSFFGYNKGGDNETLKECIDKDNSNDSCERAYVFTKCLQKQTQKSFNKLTGDLYDQASASNDTFEIDTIETTPSSILSTLETIGYNSTTMETDNSTYSESINNATMDSKFNTTAGEENGNDTLTGDLYDQASASNDTFEIETIETTPSSILSTLETIGYNSTTMKTDDNSTYSESINNAIIDAKFNTTVGEENVNDTTVEIKNGNNIYNISNTTENYVNNMIN